MDKENLTALVKELNKQQEKLISLANEQENEYYHIIDIKFKILNREYYIGEHPVMLDIIQISYKRVNFKKKYYVNIVPDSQNIVFDLDNSLLHPIVNDNICRIISGFSTKLIYISEIKDFVLRF